MEKQKSITSIFGPQKEKKKVNEDNNKDLLHNLLRIYTFYDKIKRKTVNLPL